jgi:hypothetical protein
MGGTGRKQTAQLLSAKSKEELAEELLAAKTEGNDLKQANVGSFKNYFTLYRLFFGAQQIAAWPCVPWTES